MAPEIAGPTDTESLLTPRGCLALSPCGTGQQGSRAVGGGVRSPRMMIYGGIEGLPVAGRLRGYLVNRYGRIYAVRNIEVPWH